jgi:hypothetical protein
VLSSSTIAALPAEDQQVAKDEAWVILRRHGLASKSAIVLPYRTTIYSTKPDPNGDRT